MIDVLYLFGNSSFIVSITAVIAAVMVFRAWRTLKTTSWLLVLSGAFVYVAFAYAVVQVIMVGGYPLHYAGAVVRSATTVVLLASIVSWWVIAKRNEMFLSEVKKLTEK